MVLEHVDINVHLETVFTEEDRFVLSLKNFPSGVLQISHSHEYGG